MRIKVLTRGCRTNQCEPLTPPAQHRGTLSPSRISHALYVYSRNEDPILTKHNDEICLFRDREDPVMSEYAHDPPARIQSQQLRRPNVNSSQIPIFQDPIYVHPQSRRPSFHTSPHPKTVPQVLTALMICKKISSSPHPSPPPSPSRYRTRRLNDNRWHLTQPQTG